jgi:hypothetical protein
VLNGRYSDLERRVLQAMADQNARPGEGLVLPGGMDILMMNLLADGIVVHGPPSRVQFVMAGVNTPSQVVYVLTSQGRQFIDRWLGADPLLG